MKTLTKIFVMAAFGGAAISYAGPCPQFWNRPPRAKPVATKSATRPEEARPAQPAETSGLKCTKLLMPNRGLGFGKGAPVKTVVCTPEVLHTDRRCQIACASVK
jgi:hypothetical protein